MRSLGTTAESRTAQRLVGFLLIHAAGLLLVHLALGWCWVVAFQPNEFAGFGLVIALNAAPFLVGVTAVLHARVWFKATTSRRHRLAFAVSLVMVGCFNLLYLI